MLTDDLLTRLREALGDDRVLTSDEDVDDRRHDYWVLSHLQSWRGTFEDRPGAVVRPCSTAEVQAVVRLAAETGTAVVPFGLGSGVCGGILPDRSMLLVDLSSMNRVREVDEVNLVATFDAGVNGLVAEEAVAELGLTIGHWPQSIAVSTVGGWVSTRAAGQFSTAYGNIEDMVYSLEVVLPDGTLVNLGRAPRAAAGPDLRHTFMGAEGTMGIVTGVTLALHRQPEKRTWRVFHTPTLAAGLDAQRQIMQAGWKPPVVRQYDAREARRTFRPWSVEGQGMLLMAHEGPAGRVDAEVAAVDDLASSCGLTRADVGAVDGVVAVTAHSSHAYRTGVNLYFSFAAAADGADLEGIYLACWHAVMEATALHGGGVAHHHGVGRIRRPYLVHDLGEAGVALLRTIKGAVDPRGIMNPGNLIPDP